MKLKRFEDLYDKVLSKVENVDSVELVFTLSAGGRYKLYHEQDCCESVRIEDICGDLDDLVGAPILQAEEATPTGSKECDHWAWTFYKLATIKGYVTTRWYGVSNGYYSESVDWGAA